MTTTQLNLELYSIEDKLFVFAKNLTKHREDAEDLVQETYVKVLLNKEKYLDNTNFQAWVFTILRNTFINKSNKLSSKNTVYDETEDNYIIKNTQFSNESPDSVYQESEINRVIETLTPEYNIPFKLYIEGYKYQEIAEIMNLPIGTIKSRIFFARKKLSEQLIDFI